MADIWHHVSSVKKRTPVVESAPTNKNFDQYAKWQQVPELNARRMQYLPEIQHQAQIHGIPWRLLDMVIANESGYKSAARGTLNTATGKPPDEVGIAQIRPATARMLGLQVDDKIDDRLDPAKSIGAAAKYLSGFYKESKGDWGLTGVGYVSGTIKGENRGPTAPVYKNYLSRGQVAYGNAEAPLPTAPTQTPVNDVLGMQFGIPAAAKTSTYLEPEPKKMQQMDLGDLKPKIARVDYTVKPSDYILNIAFGGAPQRGKYSTLY